MKKTLLIFFITLSALGQLLAFSGSTSTDSVGVSSNKATDVAISVSEEAALTTVAHNLLTNKVGNNSLDSGNIASTVNPRTPKALKTNNHFPLPNIQLPIPASARVPRVSGRKSRMNRNEQKIQIS